MKKQKPRKSCSTKKKLSYFAQIQSQLNKNSSRPSPLQATWVNSQGNQCKQIIGPNRCFCTHSYQCHENSKVINSTFCMVPGCKCKCYSYVPYYDIKCMCRHSYKEHDRNTKMCRMCEKCLGFVTNWCCKCGIKYELHETVFRNKKENKILINSDRNMHQTQKCKTLQLDSFCQPINTAQLQNLQKSRSKAHSKKNYQLQQQMCQKYTQHEQPYQSHFHELTENDLLFQEHKRKQINRINQKYSTLSFEKQVENSNQNIMLGLSGVRRPELARRVTAFELIIRPHNYCYVQLESFLEKQYRKNQNNQ